MRPLCDSAGRADWRHEDVAPPEVPARPAWTACRPTASVQWREHGRDRAMVRPLPRTAHVTKWLVGITLIVVLATLAGCATQLEEQLRARNRRRGRWRQRFPDTRARQD